MQRTEVTSRAIRSIGYDSQTETLEVEWHSGRLYQYDEVPTTVYSWLMRARNKGAYMTRLINERYAARDVTPHEELDLMAALRASLAAPRS